MIFINKEELNVDDIKVTALILVLSFLGILLFNT